MLLWGVTLLRLGVTRGFGAQLRRFLAICSSNRITAFFAGLGITALLQSSTAAALVVSAFASQGMVNSSTGLAILLGANVGTTLIAQLFSFNVSELMPVLMVAGYLFYSVESSGRIKNIGRIFIGLALMLLSLELIRHGSEPLKESKALPLVLKSLGSDPFFAVLVATVITWLCHSSLAVVLLVMSLVSSGVLPVVLGLYMVLGANVGGAIPPVIATLRDNPDAMRIPVGNVLTRLVGVLAAIPFIDYVLPHLEMLDPNHPRQIVNFHTEFNLVLALVFLPFTGLLNKLLKKALPDRQVADDPGKTRYLNNKDLDIPSVALAAAARETLRMGDIVQKMLEDTFSVLKTNNERLLSHIKEEDDTVDRIYNGIKNYMAKLSQEFMDPKEAQRYVQILTFSTNIEHIGDVIDKNLLPMAQKKIKNLHSFSEAGFKEIEEMHRLVIESIQLAQSLFISGDKDTARRLVQGKEIIRKAEIDGMSTHIHRLRGGVPETIATSSLHLDIIRDYRRINTYITTVAFPILEESGEIHETRLRPRKTKEQINEELSSKT